jgi:hypothetical protein
MRGGLNHADVGVDCFFFLILLALLVAVLVLVAYLALWPVPTDPEAWTVPEVPHLEGAYAANQRLTSVEAHLRPGPRARRRLLRRRGPDVRARPTRWKAPGGHRPHGWMGRKVTKAAMGI